MLDALRWVHVSWNCALRVVLWPLRAGTRASSTSSGYIGRVNHQSRRRLTFLVSLLAAPLACAPESAEPHNPALPVASGTSTDSNDGTGPNGTGSNATGSNGESSAGTTSTQPTVGGNVDPAPTTTEPATGTTSGNPEPSASNPTDTTTESTHPADTSTGTEDDTSTMGTGGTGGT